VEENSSGSAFRARMASPESPPPNSTAGAEHGLGKSATGSPRQSKRWAVTPEARALLEAVYEQSPTPTAAVRDWVAAQIGGSPRQVQVWFQNKRQRALAKKTAAAAALLAPFQQLPIVPMTPTTQLVTAVGQSHPSLSRTLPTEQTVTAPSPLLQLAGSQTPQAHQFAFAPPPLPPPPLPAVASQGVELPNSFAPAAQAGGEGSRGLGGMRRNLTTDSLADLAEVAECVDSIEHLTGGLQRISSLKDLAKLSSGLGDPPSHGAALGGSPIKPPSRVCSLKDLAAISRVASLKDLSELVF